LRYVYYLTEKLRNLFHLFKSVIIQWNPCIFYDFLSTNELNIDQYFVQFVANNVTLNFIQSILLTIILCVYGGFSDNGSNTCWPSVILTNEMSMWKLEHKVVQSRVFLVQYDDVQVTSYFNVELYQLLFFFF